jgi:hypothetical protein
LQAFAAVEQEPGERVDGDAAREYFAHDLAIAFCLTVAKVALALGLLALLFFLLAPPFLGCLHLRGIIGGSFYHETSPFRSRAKPARSACEWSGRFCEWPKKSFWWPFACYPAWRAARPKPALPVLCGIVWLAPYGGWSRRSRHLTCGA